MTAMPGPIARRAAAAAHGRRPCAVLAVAAPRRRARRKREEPRPRNAGTLHRAGVRPPRVCESRSRRSSSAAAARCATSRPARATIVVGAHYDTVPGSPGADDNASGVAVLIELAALRKRSCRCASWPSRTRRCRTSSGPEMGSWAWAKRARERGERDPRHVLARDARLLPRHARQPALPAAARLVLSRPRRLHRLRRRPRRARPGSPGNRGFQKECEVSLGRRRRARLRPRRDLVRPLVVPPATAFPR